MSYPASYQKKPLLTPAKNPLVVPTRALAEAIETEWAAHGKYVAASMPLTQLAFTAIDRIDGRREDMVEVLLVYVDTDTLVYRATGSEVLAERQRDAWDPLIGWIGRECGAIWQVTTGVMPVEQSPEVHQAIRHRLAAMSAMELAALSILASLYSSLVLAIAVITQKMDAEEAFALSRLEEDFQAERWGGTPEAEERRAKMQAETLSAGRFLRLLVEG